MKKHTKNILGAFLLLVLAGIFSTGCVEHRYYHEHHYHTRGWYESRHQAPPAGVEFDIHN
jgi:hypothetical protein